MIKITSLEYVKKTWTLTIENNEVIKLYEQVVINNNLIGKEVLTESEFKLIKEENIYYLALDKALKFLKRIKSKSEVIKFLYKEEFSSGIINQVVIYLEKYNFINDKFIISEILNKKISNKMKIYQLETKGINKESFIHLLTDETSLIEEMLNLYKKRLKIWDYENKQKAIRYLLNKGFDYEDVKKVIEF